jgi:hypothetical protein
MALFIIILFFVILCFSFDYVISKSIEETIQKPSVSTNTIRYPSQVICDNCKSNVFPTRKNIDTSTWDLKCDCGNVAYKHPKREERIEQIKNLLN